MSNQKELAYKVLLDLAQKEIEKCKFCEGEANDRGLCSDEHRAMRLAVSQHRIIMFGRKP